MPVYSYLLKYLQDGDKILLYARGENGKKIYDFLKTQPQYSIVGFVDRNADTLTNAEVPVYGPNQLEEIPCEVYDKVLITVMSQNMGVEIYQILRENGVEERKIAAPYTYLGPVTRLSLEDFIGNPCIVQNEIKIFLKNKYKNLLYFEPLIQSLKTQKDTKDTLLPTIKNIVSSLPPLENILLLYILYMSDVFDHQLMEYLLLSALNVRQPELRQFLHGVFNDISTMCFMHAEYLFPEFYNLRRQFLKQLCGMYELHIKSNQIEKSGSRKIKKICIFNHTLFGKKSSPTLLSIQISGILANLNYEVKVMPLDVYSYIGVDTPIFAPLYDRAYSGASEFKDYHKSVYHPRVSIEYTDIIDMGEKMQSQLDQLAAFSPDLILDMSDEFSVLSYIYSQYFPTLYLPLRGYQSSSFFTCYAVTEPNSFIKTNEVYHSINVDQAVRWPACIIPPMPQTTYNRKQFSLEEEDFILITVGGRLNTEMSKEFIDTVCEKVLSCPNVKWLILGSENEYLSERYRSLVDKRQIVYISYENDLPAFYQICDVYLNPKRQGGATSIFWAMYHIPIAMMRTTCDMAEVIGLENMIDGTFDQVMDYVLELKQDSNFYTKERNRFRQRALFYEGQQVQAIQDVINTLENQMEPGNA